MSRPLTDSTRDLPAPRLGRVAADLDPWLYEPFARDKQSISPTNKGGAKAVVKLAMMLYTTLPRPLRCGLARDVRQIEREELARQIAEMTWPFRALKALGAISDERREAFIVYLENAAARKGADA